MKDAADLPEPAVLAREITDELNAALEELEDFGGVGEIQE